MKKIVITALLFGWFTTTRGQETIKLNQQEKDAIQYMREEEKLARDVYNFLYDKWNTNPFDNIRQSEQTHMDRMKTLISTYRLADPVTMNNDKQGVFQNIFLQQQYNELITAGSRSLAEALKAGAKIEELDIADLEERIKQTARQDILSAYNDLKRASENHLRAFVRRLTAQGVSYTPVLLEQTAFDRIVAGSGNQRRGRRNGWN